MVSLAQINALPNSLSICSSMRAHENYLAHTSYHGKKGTHCICVSYFVRSWYQRGVDNVHGLPGHGRLFRLKQIVAVSKKISNTIGSQLFILSYTFMRCISGYQTGMTTERSLNRNDPSTSTREEVLQKEIIPYMAPQGISHTNIVQEHAITWQIEQGP